MNLCMQGAVLSSGTSRFVGGGARFWAVRADDVRGYLVVCEAGVAGGLARRGWDACSLAVLWALSGHLLFGEH